jgi:hypothetical protein
MIITGNEIHASSPIILGMDTNGGNFQTTTIATVPGLGTAWFNEHTITNIIAFHEMAKLCTITYDSKLEDAFIVHTPMVMKFMKAPNGLYIYRQSLQIGDSTTGKTGVDTPVNNKKTMAEAHFITTVEENKKFYTDRQIARAEKASNIFHAIGTPTVDDMKKAIGMNTIKNCPVTTDDVILAEKNYGPDVGVC